MDSELYKLYYVSYFEKIKIKRAKVHSEALKIYILPKWNIVQSFVGLSLLDAKLLWI